MPSTIPFPALAAALACFITLLLTKAGMPSVLSSALIAALSALWLLRARSEHAPLMALAVFSGSFGGMTAQAGDMLPNALLLSLCVGLAWEAIAQLTRHYPKSLGLGMGGRLGAIAFMGAGFFVIIMLALTKNLAIAQAPLPNLALLLALYIPASAAGAVLPYLLLQQKLFALSAPLRVALSAGLTLIATAPLYLVWPQIAAHIAPAFYAGIFVSMSAANFLPNAKSFLIAGLLCGLLLPFTQMLWGGLGGLLGLTAFIAVGLCQWHDRRAH